MGEGWFQPVMILGSFFFPISFSCINFLSHMFFFPYFTGTFGQVLECWDRENKEMVAIKIIRAVDKYREAAMIEIDVLQQLKKQEDSVSR